MMRARPPSLFVWGFGALFLAASGALHAAERPDSHAKSDGKDASPGKQLERLRKEKAKVSKPAAPARSVRATDGVDGAAFVDELLQKEWKALGFAVAEDCTDGEFIRRATIDIIGRIPTLEETEAYLRDKQPGKKGRLIDRLLASDAYGPHWATIWSRRMITDGQTGGANQDVNPLALEAWLAREFNRNTGWDAMVRELIGGNGRWDENGAVNFVLANMRNGNATQLTSYVTRLFLCVQTQCTECHDHPWNEWKQDQFHGLDAFFRGTRERRVTRQLPNGQIATDYYELSEVPLQELDPSERGVTFERRTGQVSFTPPTYLDGRDVKALARGEKPKPPTTELVSLERLAAEVANFDLDDKVQAEKPLYLRQELAKALTARDNPYFARAIVNRLWRHYLGYSFIREVDDFDNGQDEPSMPELLDRLAADFIEHGYDVKRLTKVIASSRAYGLSSKYKGKESDETSAFFVRMLCKPLSPEQLYDSVMTLTEAHKTSKSADTSAARGAFLDRFRATFGDDEISGSAPKYNGTITQALMMMNSWEISRVCACEPGTFLHRLATDTTIKDEDKVDRIYLAGLSRRPNGQEAKLARALLRDAGPKYAPEVLADILWAVLNSAEFVLNH